ncbi:MAG TPA: hypothetical protein VFQ23_20390 [Anaerolineales bacterium]|nr:hypothetical protein [Anaerolineales bacterium]
MKKVHQQPVERKMDEKIKGGISLWDRITNDPEFMKLKREIQARYGLPLNYDIRLNNQDWSNWLGDDDRPSSQKSKRGQAFLDDVTALFKKFQIPDAWHNDLFAEIAGRSYSTAEEIWGTPKFEIYRDGDGNWKWQCIVTPETDLTNPVNLHLIKEQQKAWAGDPPKPVKDKSNQRKLDWRPVYEWYKRHPLFTVEEIAKKIGYPAQRVKLRFSEFETKE